MGSIDSLLLHFTLPSFAITLCGSESAKSESNHGATASVVHDVIARSVQLVQRSTKHFDVINDERHHYITLTRRVIDDTQSYYSLHRQHSASTF